MKTIGNKDRFDVVVIGGGAAGVGVSIALRHAGIENFTILERATIGASFASWPAETRFITPPSQPPDWDAGSEFDCDCVSPAFSLEVEHPTGAEYASHLRGVAHFFNPVRQETTVHRITKPTAISIDTEDETLQAKHVIWAAGEFQYPQLVFPE